MNRHLCRRVQEFVRTALPEDCVVLAAHASAFGWSPGLNAVFLQEEDGGDGANTPTQCSIFLLALPDTVATGIDLDGKWAPRGSQTFFCLCAAEHLGNHLDCHNLYTGFPEAVIVGGVVEDACVL